ncbi:amino acid adenylation domain-containing protein [Micromonospora sp. CPCC 205546]|uniref:amino acid adenylation domain-containing protein n=1 Tax=Micromonospora sp. CPCC 205546 TaxID=3122397 RepID=UPI002FEEB008
MSAELSPLQRQLLAQIIKGGGVGAPMPAPATLPRRRGNDPVPLSYAQEAVWHLHQIAGDVPLFNVVAADWMADGTDAASFVRALRGVVERHDAMRMAIQAGADGRPLLTVAAEVPVEVEELTAADGDGPDGVFAAALAVTARPYRLDQAPLWRAAVITTPSGRRLALFAAHHIALDAASLALVIEDMASGGSPPPVGFLDFAVWQRDRIRDGGAKADLDYWRRRLAALPDPLALPTDRPRPAHRDLSGATIHRDVPKAVVDRLHAVGRASGATTYMTMLAAYLVLLHRYTGDSDLIVGASVSGRVRPELQRMIGMLVNVVPIRATVTGRESFQTLLPQVRDRVAEALEHQGVPFAVVVRETSPTHSPSQPPLAQVGFNMPTQENTAYRVRPALPITPQGSLLDFTVHVVPAAQGALRVELEYSTALFDESTATDLLTTYVELVDRLTADPALAVGRVPLTVRSAVTGGSETPPALLPELVAAQAARTPDAVAVEDGGTSLTYRELLDQVQSLAARLAERGVGPETPVGVHLPRGAAAVVALLAVWRAGGCYVPLDPEHPRARIETIVADAGVRTLLAAPADAGRLAELGVEVLTVDESARGVPFPQVRLAAGHAAYVMYTSGSTGRPKGVVVTHGGIANRVWWPVNRLGLGASDRVLQKTALTFDAAGWEMFGPLISGGTVVVAPPDAPRDAAVMLRAVAEGAVTVLQVVPSVLRQLLAADGWAGCTSLRLLFSAGEPLTGELCAQVRDRVDVTIVNTYGPTECAIDVTAYRWPQEQSRGPVPIGSPLDGLRAVLLGRDGELVPRGAVGQLYVGGVNVGRGYVGRPDLTAARFVPDPYGPPGSRMYHTGDLARQRSGGEFEFVGRADDQIKINGVRVEPGEVERALETHPPVRAAAVLGRPRPDGGRQLVAFLVTDAAIETGALRAHLRRTLPEAMLPALFVRVDAIPTTSSGKIDAAALLNGVPDGLPPGERALPTDELEQVVAQEWATVLATVDTVGRHDDFFALGGHSLQLGELAARLRTRTGGAVSLAQLYQATTVADQADLLRRDAAAAGNGTDAADRPAAPEIEVLPRNGLLPLSAGQQRMWMAEQLSPGSPEQMVPVVVPLPAQMTLTEVSAALARVVERHEILRTRYEMVDEQLTQVVDPPAPVEIQLVEATGADAVTRQIRELTQRSFDLATDPVLRARLVRSGPDRQSLVLLVHHIAWDGVSTQILAAEMSSPGPAAAPAVQYADYAAWQSSWLAGPQAASGLEHWQRLLRGARATELPTDLPRPAHWQGRGALYVFRVPAPVAAPFVQVGQQLGATPFMTFLAAFNCLLAELTGTREIVVGAPVAGRTNPAVEKLIGYFANILVLRTEVDPGDDFRAVLRRTRESSLAAYAHQDIPFDRVLDSLRIARDRSRNPLFQIMFEVGQERPSYLPDLPEQLDLLSLPWPTAIYDLTVTLSEEPDGGYLGLVEYSTDLFRPASIERLIRRYRHLLEQVATDPDASVGGLAARTLPELLGRQAAARPDAVAVEQGGDRLTYGELARRVGVAAARLRAAGVGPESTVAVCLPRGLDLIVTALAVMAAGGVHAPLDVTGPGARLASIVASMDPAVVVVTPDAVGSVPSGGPAVLVPEDLRTSAPRGDGGVRGPGAGDRPDTALAGQLAYLIHTSGSTGEPKGVQVEHGAFLAHCEDVALRYGLAATDRILTTSPPFVDVAMEHLGMTLVSGATLVLAAAGGWSPADLPDVVAATRVTFLDLPPMAWRDMLDRVVKADSRLDTLRAVNIGTDVVYAEDVHRWHELGIDARFIACYGPTEAVVTSTLYEVTEARAASLPHGAVVPIGTEVGRTVGYVLDEQLRQVRPGARGELFLGGGLARGYHGRPSLTAERFLPDPFSTVPGARMYRTGDVVSRNAEGVLDFHGRADRQVKINGFRVEPAEVEACLLTHPGIRAASVTAATRGGAAQLVGYVVAADPTPPDARDLGAYLRARLPEAMVPRHWVFLAELPKSGAGKVDLRALPPIAAEAGDDEGERTGEASAEATVEDLIAEIWCAVLGLPAVEHDADFFAIGGNSLLATRVRTRIQDLFAVTIPLGDLFGATTVGQQVELVTRLVVDEVDALPEDEVAALLLDQDEPGERR